MMRVSYGVVLGVLYLCSFWVSYRATKDFFSPLCFFSILQGIAYIPGIVFFDTHLNVELGDANCFIVLIMQMLVLLLTWLGIAFYRNTHARRATYHYAIMQKRTNMTLVGVGLYVIGFTAMVGFIQAAGGLRYVLEHPMMNHAQGLSYLWSMNQLMVIGMLCFWGSERPPNAMLTTVTFLVFAVMIGVFTKRAPILEALLVLAMARHYRRARLRVRDFLRPQALTIVLLCSLLVVILPRLRGSSGFDIAAIRDSSIAIVDVFEEFSFISRDAFVYTHYTVENMYYGRTLLNLLAAPLPSRLFSWKPPTDDGIYLANFIRGDYVAPPSRELPFWSSVPFSSQGSLYANFGILGVIIGSLMTGMIYEHAYTVLKEARFHISMIYIYYVVMYKFAFSSKNITQCLIAVGLAAIAFRVFAGIKLVKRRVHPE